MRKSVQDGPLPDTDAQAQGEGSGGRRERQGGPPRSRGWAEAGRCDRESLRRARAGPAIGPDDEASLNDAWLVERARHGDHAAFAILVRRYERKLIRVLARLVRDPELARDLAQETFWRVYSRLDRFDTARRFGPWLFRVGVNLGLDQLRRSPERAFPARIHRSAPRRRPYCRSSFPIRTPESRPSWPRKSSIILAQMPVSYRTILVLRDLEGFSIVGGRGHRRASGGDRFAGASPRPGTSSAKSGSVGRKESQREAKDG